MFFLKMPQVLIDVLGSGPLPNMAKDLLKFLHDPRKTRLNLVTLPLEMPVVETLEYLDQIDHGTDVQIGGVFLNAMHPDPVSADHEAHYRRICEDQGWP